MDTTRQLAIVTDQKGLALVYIAICIFVLLGFLGLAVDLGHLQVVRGELQNDSDAAALAGAGSLYDKPTSPGGTPTLDWNAAQTAATSFISKNMSDKVALSDGAVQVGYWNLSWDPSTNPALKPTTTATLASGDVAAVKVTVSRSTGNNGGPVGTFFMQALGISNAPVSSKASVAVIGFPGSAPAGTLFPMVLSACMTDQYFSQNPLPSPPTEIKITSLYSAGGSNCYTGQWTSFQTDSNSVPTVEGFIDNGSPSPLKLGDDVWVQPGEKNSLYNYVSSWLPAGGKDVLMAVVDSNVTVHADMPIVGFATFHIDSANNGSNPYIQGHFGNFFTSPPGSQPGGSVSNTITMPLMVQ